MTGSVLATSNSGTVAVFSDTIHTPNQVYIVNVTNANSPFGHLPEYFLRRGCGILSRWIEDLHPRRQHRQFPLRLLHPAGLAGTDCAPGTRRRGGGFSPNGAFGYVAEAASGSGSANLTAFATCNNQVAASLPLPADPILMRVLPQDAPRRQGFLRLSDSRWHSRVGARRYRLRYHYFHDLAPVTRKPLPSDLDIRPQPRPQIACRAARRIESGHAPASPQFLRIRGRLATLRRLRQQRQHPGL